VLNGTIASRACILNYGPAAWAFEELAKQLSAKLGIDVATQPRDFNYLLGADPVDLHDGHAQFVDAETIRRASDKRLLVGAFKAEQVPTPVTELMDDIEAARAWVERHPDLEWCLKFPTGTGAAGHRLFTTETNVPASWPTPFVLQEFIRLEEPEVYRTYAADGRVFGWMLRRYESGSGSPWVAHARGARWHRLEGPPAAAVTAATRALHATELLQSFGCVDLLRRPDGSWVVLEVGTDGLFTHVDRDLGDTAFEAELLERICAAFARQATSALSLRA
jgi:glutathione synthase/RimK-type ligase-like ATP-grasp enzyme